MEPPQMKEDILCIKFKDIVNNTSTVVYIIL